MFYLPAYAAMALGLYLFHSAWLAFAFYHGFILLTLSRQEARPLWRELLTGWQPGIGWAAVAFGLGGGVLLYLLAPAAGVDSAQLTAALSRLGLTGLSWQLFVAYHILVNPWLEEVFWRGKLGSNARGLVTGDFFFAGYHVLVLVLFLPWPFILLSFTTLVAAAWLWRQLTTRCGGLLVPAISHLAADAGIMVVAYRLAG